MAHKTRTNYGTGLKKCFDSCTCPQCREKAKILMKPIIIPDNFNYIGVFLTLACQYNCAYCINHHGEFKERKVMSGEQWIAGLNRIRTRGDLPITIQGGEPTLHKHFFRIINGISKEIPVDVLTNLKISADVFMQAIRPERLTRESKYASIRVSYHHGQSDFEKLLKKVGKMQGRGYDIGIWEVNHPEYKADVLQRQHIARHMGIDYRLKEFLGEWKGKDYGLMRYTGAVNSSSICSCHCKTTELLIAPDGYLFRCHSDLYAGLHSIGHLMGDRPPMLGLWRTCNRYGKCNSCDVKIKTDRTQTFGHTSVEIKNVSGD